MAVKAFENLLELTERLEPHMRLKLDWIAFEVVLVLALTQRQRARRRSHSPSATTSSCISMTGNKASNWPPIL